MLQFRDLHAALARCMEAHPPAGLERSLHHDANALAGLWALMLYQRSSEVSLEGVNAEVITALGRWSSTAR